MTAQTHGFLESSSPAFFSSLNECEGLHVFSCHLHRRSLCQTSFIFGTSYQYLETTKAKQRTALPTLLVSSMMVSRKVVVQVHDL
jgi:hypothetical protein